jgi:hypothetical protein
VKLSNDIASIKRMLTKNASQFGVTRSVFCPAETRWGAWANLANVQQTHIVAYGSTELSAWRALAKKAEKCDGK